VYVSIKSVVINFNLFPFGNNDDSELTIHDKNAESWDISDLLKASLWKQ